MKRIRVLIIAMLLAIACGDAFAQTIEQVTGIPKNETKAERKAREKKLKALVIIDAITSPKKKVDQRIIWRPEREFRLRKSYLFIFEIVLCKNNDKSLKMMHAGGVNW